MAERDRPSHAMEKGGHLLAVRDGRTLRFPAWQIAGIEDALVPGLRLVLGVANASASWLLSPTPNPNPTLLMPSDKGVAFYLELSSEPFLVVFIAFRR